jgi:hypothetical protein
MEGLKGSGVVAIYLEIMSGPLTGKQAAVPEDRALTVGRGERAGLAVPGDTRISGVHFAVEWDGKVCRVMDRRSTNGTTLNGNPVTEAIVREGDMIGAGDTKFVVRFGAQAQQPSPTAQPAAGSSPPPAAPAGSPASRASASVPSVSVPAVPSVPQVPSINVPAVPAVPSGPSIPAMPGIAAVGVPAVLAGTGMPTAPAGAHKMLLGLPFVPIPLGVHIPQIPPGPVMPGMPGFAIPGVPSMPAIPQIPNVSLPGMPTLPSVPSLAVPSVALPQVPAIPSLPALPTLPRPIIPTFSAAELAAMLAEAARRALKALWQPSLVVGGWKFMVIPKGWVVPEERIGINCAHQGVFPAHILAAEEPLSEGGALQQLRDTHIYMFRQHMHEPRITEHKPPQIPGAGTVLAMDVVYKLDSGASVLLRRIYAQSGQIAGVLTLMTLMDDFPRILPDLQIIQSNLRFEPQQPPPSGAIPGLISAQA